jgi:hypothetical protein
VPFGVHSLLLWGNVVQALVFLCNELFVVLPLFLHCLLWPLYYLFFDLHPLISSHIPGIILIRKKNIQKHSFHSELTPWYEKQICSFSDVGKIHRNEHPQLVVLV